MDWQFLVPNLPVRDVPTAQEWYRDTLGLGINWIWEDNFGSVGADCVELFLYESDEPRPAICSVFVDDVEAIYERARERGGEIVSELELKPCMCASSRSATLTGMSSASGAARKLPSVRS
jgi:hypothetical protein